MKKFSITKKNNTMLYCNDIIIYALCRRQIQKHINFKIIKSRLRALDNHAVGFISTFKSYLHTILIF